MTNSPVAQTRATVLEHPGPSGLDQWHAALRGLITRQAPVCGSFFLLSATGLAEIASEHTQPREWAIPALQPPSESEYPWPHTIPSVGLALAPWIIQHLFQHGFAEVLCVGAPCSTSLEAHQPSGWWSLLETGKDLCLSETDSTIIARDGETAQWFLAARQAQLQRSAHRALSTSSVVWQLPCPSSPPPNNRVISIVGPPLAQKSSDPDGAATQDLRLISTDRLPPTLQRVQRLHHIYRSVLAQQADPGAVLRFGPTTDTRLGRWRLRLSLAIARLRTERPTVPDKTLATPPPSSHAPSRRSVLPSAPPQQGPAGINLMGYVRADLGLGEAARSLALACKAADTPFSVTDLGHQTLHPQSSYAILDAAVSARFPIDLHYVNATHAQPTALWLEAQGLGRNRYTIGFWHWEQPALPAAHHAAFQYVDEVWAPSTFVADAIAAVSPVPVFKLPHAVACEASPQAHRSQFGLPADRLLVLVMYDFLSYQFRKNPEAAISAFRLAARQQPAMGLVIKTINGDKHPEALTQLKASVADLPHVHFVDRFLSRQQAWDLQACCDVLLSLHRAEGFGLAPAEMMRLGKAVVATGWSANMDFMTHENAMPVRFSLHPLAHDVGAYPAGPLWAEADVEHAAWCLQQLAQDPARRQALGQRAASDIRHQLSPARVGEHMVSRLKMLGCWYPDLLMPARLPSPWANPTPT